MPDSDVKPYVYLIFSASDKALAHRLIGDLPAWGLPVRFVAMEDSATPSAVVISTVIESARVVLLLDSPEARESPAVQEALDIARHYNRPIRIILATGPFAAKDQLSLANPQGPGDSADHYQRLIEQIIDLVGLKAAPPLPLPIPEPEYGDANEDDIAAEAYNSLNYRAQPSTDSPILPPITATPGSGAIPKPAMVSPVTSVVPGPSPYDYSEYGSGGGAATAKASREPPVGQRRARDESPANRKSKKSESAGDSKAAATEADAAMPAVEDVQFTAFRPETVAVEQWLTMLVYAHADRARDLITANADKFAEQMGGKPKAVRGKAGAQIARGTELRIVPTCDGVQFNPESISVKWIEDWHRVEFRFRAEAALSGTEDVARVAIYAGPLLVGQIKLALTFTTAQPIPAPNILSVFTGRGKAKTRGKLKPTSAKMYTAQQIFLSYSHADSNIVLACRDACKRLGFIPLIDIDTLRAGQHWNDELMNMIERADIFQLFWSERAAQSKYVQQEWEYALQLVQQKSKGPDFIRPTYWEKPPAPIPELLADIHFDYTPALG